ncbi:hypothetical protein KAFR_0F04250 [Kazachstania africana CBS 2517]|uniref:Thioredoxin domain-containing protein n=1 Tax=Kazachstania africana (strain ATCC 22294 / BCRC 22015 / CBS 2517 / CECT 1963 / NBRC 1671 / NRRL Y-8276) TaxID=1071382 RepID=H2AXC0_KAZAF|nr:hypothetical protein KAFR_0F04250 [Kazachstania africana CBS 2517]CCF59020.1 hypothetical protein KAFR_0F04250 [Kazachstania africana CBS 2517]
MNRVGTRVTWRVGARRFQSSYATIPKLKTVKEFNDIVKTSSDKLSVVDFYATWCQPCKAMIPLMTKLIQENPTVNFYKVDVDESMELAQSCKITAMPSFLFLKDGKTLDKVIGANTMKLLENIDEFK